MNPQTQPDDTHGGHVDFRPGDTIAPRSDTPVEPVVPAAPAPLAQAQPLAQTEAAAGTPPVTPVQLSAAPEPVSPAAPGLVGAEPPKPSSGSSFLPLTPDSAPGHQEFTSVPDEQAGTDGEYEDDTAISWTASEFIAHHKSPLWYAVLGAGALMAALVIYLVTKDVVSTVVVLFVAVIFGVSAGRQPRQLQYALDGNGLSIRHKFYPYHDFRTFSVIDEGSFSSITFMPLKRFAPSLSIYYDPDDEDRIIDVIADHLPMQEHTHDAVDRLMRRIRF